VDCDHVSPLNVSQLLLDLAFLTLVFWLYLVVALKGDERFPRTCHRSETWWPTSGLYQLMEFIPAQNENKDHKIKYDPTQSLLETPPPTPCTGPPSARPLLRFDRTILNTTSCRDNMALPDELHKAALCSARTQTQGKKRLRKKGEISVVAQRKGGIEVSLAQQSCTWLQRCCAESKSISLSSFCTRFLHLDTSSELITSERASHIWPQPQLCTISEVSHLPPSEEKLPGSQLGLHYSLCATGEGRQRVKSLAEPLLFRHRG